MAAAVATAAALSVTAGASADWPSYGHDLFNSRNAGPTAPSPRMARELAPAWSYRVPTGGITGTPVVAGGTLVTTSSKCVVYALDAATGRPEWKRRLKSLGCGYTPGSPAIDGGVVYVAMGSSGGKGPQVVAMTLDHGAILWHAFLDPTQGFADTYASPTVWNGSVYAGISGIVEEEGLAKGLHLRGAVTALDAATGALRWRWYTVPPSFDGGPVWSTAAVDPATGVLFAGTGNAYHRPAAPTTDSIVALSATGGDYLGSYSAVPNDVFLDRHSGNGPDADFGSSPNLFAAPDGRPLVGDLAKNGTYWALDRQTMAPVWSRPTGTVHVGEAIASTASDGARIYGQNDKGQVWALGTDGHRLWSTHRNGAANFSPLAVGNGVLYSIEYRGFLDVRLASTGRRLARLQLPAASWGGVSVSGHTVFAATGTDLASRGWIVAFRPR
ncbi:MAG: PQQ-binding-like beta-propeller repeat protein [Thermoleophilaceae bacterium]